MVDRTESRIGERLLRFLFQPIQYLAPTLLTTPVKILATSMIANTVYSLKSPVTSEIVDNQKIFDLADMYNKST